MLNILAIHRTSYRKSKREAYFYLKPDFTLKTQFY